MNTNAPITVEVPRKDWQRGGEEGGHLYRSCTGESCVLGFILRARGVSYDTLDNHSIPASLWGDHLDDKEKEVIEEFLTPESVNYCYRDDKSWVEEMYNTNDDFNLTDEERERRLINLAKKHGITLVFTGKDDE